VQAVELASFGGLNLRDDPQQVGLSGAIDLKNVDFDRPGQVRSRDGTATFTAALAASAYDSLYPYFDTGAAGI
jgi:hypothetical protein